MDSILVTRLGKAYKQYPSRKARLMEWLFPFLGERHTKHWVLKDVTFSLRQGEAVGIVGVNGAGKSTLLKIITGITQPTTGHFVAKGRIAALLELGMGFHPEFTGRQNVLMAGQLLGHKIEDIENMFPAIESFAEIGEYIDKPIRTYSSGMQVRLAFSLATAKRPELLIVDEALSVGDAYFQHKSFDRIRKFREKGTSLLIVSHNRSAIQSICDRAIFLDDGHIAKEGHPDEVLDFYNAMLAERQYTQIKQKTLSDGSLQTVSGTGEVTITSVQLLDNEGRVRESVSVGDPVTLSVELTIKQSVPRLVLGFLIKDHLGQPIYGINTHRVDKAIENLQQGDRFCYRFSFKANLGKGHYSVSLSASQFDSHLDKNYQWIDRSLIFHVVNKHQEDFIGCNWLDSTVCVDRLEK
jgi:lipopolysaccharide transport system ATP-binding protein